MKHVTLIVAVALMAVALLPSAAGTCSLREIELLDTDMDMQTSATASPLESCSYGGGGNGSTTPATAAAANNTAILDVNAMPSPVVAGHYVAGGLGHLIFQNLTDGIAYTLMDAAKTKIGTLAAQGGSIQYYSVTFSALGKWNLYRDADLAALGDLASPLVTFTVASSGPVVFGSTVYLLSKSLPAIAKSMTLCFTNVTADQRTVTPGVPMGPHEVALNESFPTGSILAIEMNWSATLAQGQSAQFLVSVTRLTVDAGNTGVSASANLTLASASGKTTALIAIAPGDYQFECRVKGPADELFKTGGGNLRVIQG